MKTNISCSSKQTYTSGDKRCHPTTPVSIIDLVSPATIFLQYYLKIVGHQRISFICISNKLKEHLIWKIKRHNICFSTPK